MLSAYCDTARYGTNDREPGAHDHQRHGEAAAGGGQAASGEADLTPATAYGLPFPKMTAPVPDRLQLSEDPLLQPGWHLGEQEADLSTK